MSLLLHNDSVVGPAWQHCSRFKVATLLSCASTGFSHRHPAVLPTHGTHESGVHPGGNPCHLHNVHNQNVAATEPSKLGLPNTGVRLVVHVLELSSIGACLRSSASKHGLHAFLNTVSLAGRLRVAPARLNAAEIYCVEDVLH